MPKYAEGTVSPSGKFVVKGGAWVPVEAAPVAPQDPGMRAALAATQDTMTSPEALGAGFLGETGPAAAMGTTAAAGALVGGAAYGGANLAKDAALMGGAQLAKAAGVPGWMADTAGLISPGKRLGKLLLGGMFGGAKKEAATVATKAAVGAVDDIAVKKALADVAQKEARTQYIKDRGAREAEWHAERMARAKAGGSLRAPKAPAPKAPVEAPAPVTAKPPGPDDTIPAMAATVPSEARLVQQLQQQMGTVAGRAKVRELLSGMEPEMASQIKELLKKGMTTMPTNLGGHALPAIKTTTGPGYELAKLLGQIQ